jgi:hypothetical protein
VAVGAVIVLMWLVLALIYGTGPSEEHEQQSRLRDSVESQAIAMGQTGGAAGPAVDRAHEQCMAARGWKKR